ncbi:MAG: S8 family serine peptidase [Candidatus Kuenenbacteria bacterium]
MHKKNLFIAILLILMAGAVFNVQKTAAKQDNPAPHIAGQILIKLSDSEKIYKLNTSDDLSKIIDINKKNKSIEYIEPNYTYQAVIEPQDPFYTQQLYISDTKTNLAWNYITDSKNYTIAIIDTGVDIYHPDLKNNIWRNLDEIADNNIDDDHNGFIDDALGWDFIQDQPDPLPKFDDNYSFLGMNHGTIIAGVAAAQGNNNIGITGVAWNAKIMALRVLNGAGLGNTFDVARAIDYARKNGANVINLSFVGSGNSQTLEKAIQKANEAGILVIAAAGNEVAKGIDMTNNPEYPVCHDGYNGENWVIGVASIDKNDKLASFSNYGKCIDVTAPGVGIFSTLYKNDDYAKFQREYGGYWSGTSVSAPQVAGMAVLLKSIKPSLSLFELKNIILESSDNIDRKNLLYQNKLGYGKINVLQAVLQAKKIIPKAETLFDKIITSPQTSGGSHTKIYKINQLEGQFFAFDKEKRLGVNTTSADLNNDGNEEIIASAPIGEKPWIKIFSIDGKQENQFLAFEETFMGGVKTAVGDVDSDGQIDIIAVAQSDYAPIVKIFTPTGMLKKEFYALNKFFTKGLNIAVADINNDNFAEIIITPRNGTSPIVKIFSYNGILINQFIAGNPNSFNGVNITTGDINQDGVQEIIIGNNQGSLPQVRIYTPNGHLIHQFLAYNQNFRGGVNVACADINGDGIDEIVTGAGPGGGPHVRIFAYPNKVLSQFMAYDSKFTGGVQVSAGK